MAPAIVGVHSPNFLTFKNTVRNRGIPVESALENLIALLKRRQIKGSKLCAEATALLLRRVVEAFKVGDVSKLIEDIRRVGQRLISAQPKELAVGNIVRRVLGLIRVELEEDREGETSGYSDAGSESAADSDQRLARELKKDSPRASSSPLRNGVTDAAHVFNKEGLLMPSSGPAPKSMFNLLSQPQSDATTPSGTPRSQSPGQQSSLSKQAVANLDAAKDLRAEVVEGILEILEELKQVDEQIAGYALEHIHSNEIILTHTSSETIQKFLLKAATKRKFTVLFAETFPNDSEATADVLTGEKGASASGSGSERFQKTLTSAGVTVILVPDSAVFAVMSRVNKVILDTHVVMGNGGLVALAGAKQIAQTAKLHRTPVVVLSGVFKLSPVYPFDINVFLEDGDPSKIFDSHDKDLAEKVEVSNPLFDYVPANLIHIYITNLGGHAPSYLYRIVADHYRSEDNDLGGDLHHGS